MSFSRLFDLSGKIVLVTGSSRGLGHVIAEGYAAFGATVVLHGRDEGTLAASAARLSESVSSGRIAHCAFDIRDEASIEEGIARIEKEIGAVHALVNGAGVQFRAPLLDLGSQDWDDVLATNLTGTFLVARSCARHMIERGSGKIINVASVQSELARPTIAAYTAAKGGVRNLTRAMAAEWAGSGLQINALAPGYIKTAMTQSLVDDREFDTWLRSRTPAGRWGDPSDLVGTAVWLASAASDFVNGQTIFVDGGMTVVV